VFSGASVIGDPSTRSGAFAYISREKRGDGSRTLLVMQLAMEGHSVPATDRPVGSSSAVRAVRVGPNRWTCTPSSGLAVDRDLERLADLTHAVVAESAEALDQRPDRDALDRIEIDDRDERDRVVRRLEEDLGGDPTYRGRARPDQRPPQTRDRRVSREYDHRPAPDLWKLAPPDIASRGKRGHDAPAAARNEARSPHSSAWSSGCAS
jgi:hypothetical protein